MLHANEFGGNSGHAYCVNGLCSHMCSMSIRLLAGAGVGTRDPLPALPCPSCATLTKVLTAVRVDLLTERGEWFRRLHRVIMRSIHTKLLAPGSAQSKCLVSVSCGVVVAVSGCILQFHIFENHYSFK